MDWVPLNFGLMKNPLNYFIVGTVLLVAAIFVGHVVLPLFDKGNASS